MATGCCGAGYSLLCLTWLGAILPRRPPAFVGAQTEVDSRPLGVERKRLYFNVRENSRGRFLKIAEVNRQKRSTVIIPQRCARLAMRMWHTSAFAAALDALACPLLLPDRRLIT